MMEQLYHIKRDDSVVGPVNRDDAHSKGILHRAGMIFLIKDDSKVLLTWRSPSKKIFADMYDSSCAFHVTFGESYADAAERELLEEAGIHDALEYLGKFAFHETPENEMVAVFRCKSNQPVVLDKSESTRADYYSIDDVDRIVSSARVTPWLREGWKLVRSKLFET